MPPYFNTNLLTRIANLLTIFTNAKKEPSNFAAKYKKPRIFLLRLQIKRKNKAGIRKKFNVEI